MFTYRLDLVFDLLTVLLQVFLLKTVWVAVYAGRGSVGGVDLNSLLAFVTIANLQIWLMPPFLAGFIQERVREGTIALDLGRPVGFVEQMIAHQLGHTVAILPFAILVFPLAVLVGGIAPPSSAAAALLYVLSLALAFLVSTLINLLLGMIAFWTLEADGFLTIYEFISRFFAGVLVPLWFFPVPLRAIAGVLPFQTLAFIPISVYLGKLDGTALLQAFGLQLFWAIALYVAARLVWGLAIRRIVVQGG
jgi:ABC-2 type transport system permease protein